MAGTVLTRALCHPGLAPRAVPPPCKRLSPPMSPPGWAEAAEVAEMAGLVSLRPGWPLGLRSLPEEGQGHAQGRPAASRLARPWRP